MFEDKRCGKMLRRRKVLPRKQWKPGTKQISQMKKLPICRPSFRLQSRDTGHLLAVPTYFHYCAQFLVVVAFWEEFKDNRVTMATGTVTRELQRGRNRMDSKRQHEIHLPEPSKKRLALN